MLKNDDIYDFACCECLALAYLNVALSGCIALRDAGDELECCGEFTQQCVDNDSSVKPIHGVEGIVRHWFLCLCVIASVNQCNRTLTATRDVSVFIIVS